MMPSPARGMRPHLLVLLLLAWPVAARAQDSLVVLDPAAPAGDSVLSTGLPVGVLEELLARYNDSSTTRHNGDLTVPAGARIAGPLAGFRGVLRIAGIVEGPVTMVNGDLVLLEGARISGEVLVVGGRLTAAPGAISGARREYPAEAPVSRTSRGLLVAREPGRSLADIASAEASFEGGGLSTTLRLATLGTYNRVEGLPIIFGPRVDWPIGSGTFARLEVLGILRTAGGSGDLLPDLGVTGKFELRLGNPERIRLQLEGYSMLRSTDTEGLSASEVGWYAVLSQHDYRDYFEARGGALTGTVGLAPRLDLVLQGAWERERTVLANDPFSLFKDEDRWRPNPPIDDGDYLSGSVGLDLDTRPSPGRTGPGMHVGARIEYTNGEQVAPADVPSSVRDPVPTGDFGFTTGHLDVAGWYRLGRRTLIGGRGLLEGWLGGDPLPMQRRMALGGPGTIPGFRFRHAACAVETGYRDPATPALCERRMLLQGEVRRRVRVDWTRRIPDAERPEMERVIGIEELTLVGFMDAGAAWIPGDGPGRVPSNRLPTLSSWIADVGIGATTSGIGIYLAKALADGEPVRLELRLQARF